MRKSDWALVWLWVAFLTILGPFLLSQRDWLLFAAGVSALAGIVYFTQRRIRGVIKEKRS